jgi:hypothetical protein
LRPKPLFKHVQHLYAQVAHHHGQAQQRGHGARV